MPEWLESLLTAIGGGTVVLVGVLTIFKGLLIKLFETGIESSFEKNLEKFRNKLGDSQKIRTRTRFPKHPIFRGRWLLRCQLQQTRLETYD